MEKVIVASNKEYTFRKYNDMTFEGQVSEQSLFNGSMIQKCSLLDSNFSKSDFEGTIWEEVTINACSFKSCDIKSSIFNHIKFVNCDFSLSAINDTTFTCCTFEKCLFNQTLVSNNVFKSCIFQNNSFEMGTVTLSKFYDTSFLNLVLGNCSFYDHLMINCTYHQITINIDSIGRIYGLSMEALRNFNYIFLGITYGFAPDKFFDHIDQVFASKEWRIQKALYLFNIEKINSYEFITQIFESLCYYINNNIIVKQSDLSFIINILNQLKLECRLPMFALYQGIQELNQNIDLLEKEGYYNKPENFKEFINSTFFIFNDLLMYYSEINKDNMKIISSEKKCIVEIHYNNDKVIHFHKFLNHFLKYNGFDESYYSELIEVKRGSIIEVILMSIFSVFAFQFLLYGINGILLQIVDMETKVEAIKNKKYRKKLLESTVNGKQVQPEFIQNTFQLFENKEFNKSLSTFISAVGSANIIDTKINDKSDIE